MDTLVLDCTYQPVARVTWQRAVTLWAQSKIEIIETYEDREIRSVTFSIKMPSIVRFIRAIRRRKQALKFSRENVFMRDNGKCQYCFSRVLRHEATYDHVTPRAHGGQTTWENVVIACVDCNQKKAGRTPAQAGMPLKHAPVKPKKLPDTLRFTITWQKGMPPSWRNWLRDMQYWHGALEEG